MVVITIRIIIGRRWGRNRRNGMSSTNLKYSKVSVTSVRIFLSWNYSLNMWFDL